VRNPIREFSSKLFKGLGKKLKAVLFVLIAIAAGHICDDYFKATFPVFKICFGLIGLMIYISVNNTPADEEK